MPYETAYIGIATTPSGDFDHFVQQLKTSHLAGGYWKFQSTDDDRRAYARGFTTPEDVLCAAESTSEGFDEIFIRWIKGANDPNISMALSGNSSQHLQTIYELRLLLGLPVSSRGQIPLYPISTEPRLRQYWEGKYRAQRPNIIDAGSQLPDQPIASPVTPRTETLVSAQPQHPVQATPKPPVGRIMRAQSKEMSQVARATPASKTTSLQNPFNATTEHLIRSPAARALPREVAVSSLPSSTVSRHQVTPRDDSSLASTSISPAPSAGRYVPSIPRAALEWGLQPSTSPTSSTLDQGITQHNWVHPSSRNPKAIATSNTLYRSPYAVSGTQPGHTIPVVAALKLPLEINKNAALPCNAATTSVTTANTVDTAPAKSFSSPVAVTAEPPATAESACDSQVLTSPDTSHHVFPTILSRRLHAPFLDSMGSPIPPQSGSPPSRTGVAQLGESFTLEDTLMEPPDRPASVDNEHRQLPENKPSPQQELGQLNIGSPDVCGAEEVSRAQATEAVSESLRTYMEDLNNLPCVDCGEYDGHTWDCHLGNIQPMQNLTMLDYRILAEAVNKFDPGPWTTHFETHPQPEVEDVETQIRGIAEVIRNEDSYKMDKELHNLSDEFMIMLWGFKTSDKVRVIDQYD
ncbi:hypothetical protein AA0111_g11692 [Alternaria arborescens]|uniref:hypothetical protein n=1 Tax=Alternaria arborescens TaxID=156630 RepID=UPI001074E155|nr:hypothetical protein AA0111_g11692 [Alternaria arborescens]RYO15457.1 hypothetical protein AA0111_g11692 [Alternaria arborescens]